MISRTDVRAIAGQGLEGDRYWSGTGFYSDRPTTEGARELTLIQLDAFEEIETAHGISFATSESRRNVITDGIELSGLIGKRFRMGDVVCEGVRDCPPCVHLEELTGKQVMKPLLRSGGLRARIVEGGTIRLGDPIEVTGKAEGSFVRRDAGE